jgi:Ni/Fe-hydrogenase subunit HybB-like protein
MTAVNNQSRSRWNVFNWWLLALLTFMVGGLIGATVVFSQGLVVTNMSDLVPWGIWIAIDLACIALSAGAFLFSAAVYLMGLKQFQPLARTAVFIGLIGYTMALMTLMLDIGRPDRFWHGMVYWNYHSPLWEVTICVALYLCVLSLETAPIIGEASWFKSRWPWLAHRLESAHKLTPLLAVAGLGLSMLHQSSLGATFGVLKARPIWYQPGLAFMFMASAVAAGPAMTALASMLAARITPMARIKDHLLEQVSAFVGWALVVFLYLRFWEILSMNYTHQPGRSEALHMLTRGELAFNFWVGEIILGAIIPIVILLRSRWRRNANWRMLALFLVVGGLAAHRWNVVMAGQLVVFAHLPLATGAVFAYYTPSFIEVLCASGIIAYGLLAFTIGVRYLGVVDHWHHEEDSAPVALTAAAAD